MIRVITGDCRAVLPTLGTDRFNCCVTSPPYFGLRDYGVAGQIGLEDTLDAYIAEMVAVFAAVRRVLRPDGTLWLNLGDSYASTAPGTRNGSGTGLQSKPEQIAFRPDYRKGALRIKPKDLMMVPARVALALQADGWWLRSEIIWAKPNPMPESVTDRPTSAHEKVFLFAKSERYFYDADAVREPYNEASLGRYASPIQGTAPTNRQPGGDVGRKRREEGLISPNALGRNLRNVWTIASQPFPEAHFATFPPALVEPCIKAGCPKGGTVLDPFGGAGTVGLVADRLGRDALLVELNPAYAEMARGRIANDAPLLAVFG